MSNHIQHLDYNDFQAIVAKARMQRSVAVGDAIAGVLAVVISGLAHATAAVKSGLGKARPRAESGESPILEASGHR